MRSWAVLLEGHDFDLEDWRALLIAPFDPVVEIAEIPDGAGGSVKGYLLKAAMFASCDNPGEVREIAVPLVRALNGLMTAYGHSRPVTFSTVIELVDGSCRRHLRLQLEGGEYRLRGSTVAIAVSGLPHAPQPSSIQKGLELASGDSLAALEHLSRADNWHDLYKAFEAIRAAVGNKAEIVDLGFLTRDVDDFTMSAQIARHHRTNGQPSRVWQFAEARDFVGRVIREYLNRLA